ncbi:hypothetical protein U1Q18_011093 [Sarracenia purpurea var. burkii]
MSSSGQLDLPPGFRFHPTDEELVMHYLCRRCAAQPIAVPIIAEIDLYKFDPWQLPGMALYGEKECSGHVTLPEFTSEKEVQSEFKWEDLEKDLDFQFNYMDAAFADDPFDPQQQFQLDQLFPVEDMFMYDQKPFQPSDQIRFQAPQKEY